jgi:hypothetical protein
VFSAGCAYVATGFILNGGFEDVRLLPFSTCSGDDDEERGYSGRNKTGNNNRSKNKDRSGNDGSIWAGFANCERSDDAVQIFSHDLTDRDWAMKAASEQ